MIDAASMPTASMPTPSEPTRRGKIDYLRHRPFLVIDVYYQPARGAKTHRRGWGLASDAWQSIEHPRIVDRITYKHQVRASVIIDLTRRKLLKSRYEETQGDTLLDHFMNKYADQITSAIIAWRMRTSPLDATMRDQDAHPASHNGGGITVTMG